jgi:hypothetical protein
LHAGPPQTYGVHAVTVPALHVPEPLQVAAEVWFPVKLEHDAAVHTVPEGQSRHAPALHVPSKPQLDAAVAAQRLRGSTVPSTTLPQVPFAFPLSVAEHA